MGRTAHWDAASFWQPRLEVKGLQPGFALGRTVAQAVQMGEHYGRYFAFSICNAAMQ